MSVWFFTLPFGFELDGRVNQQLPQVKNTIIRDLDAYLLTNNIGDGAFASESNRKLLKSLSAICGIILVAWTSPPLASTLLMLFPVSSTQVGLEIYGIVAGGAIEVATALTMPTLFIFRFLFVYKQKRMRR